MELDDHEVAAWLARDEPTLVVCGAGLSVAAPTCAPGVWPFLWRTWAAMHAATEFEPDGRYTERLFPETCYGAIGEASGSIDHLRIWKVLGPSAARRVGAKPNQAHHLVTDLAVAHGWPVLTTNFDCFIEAAAAEQRVPCSVVMPTFSQGTIAVSRQPGAMIVVKLHGTATDYTTIRATAADLSRCALMVARLKFQPKPRRLLVIGYSGRDFDLFPWLANGFDDIVWVDPFIPPDHRLHTIPGVSWWTGDAVGIAALQTGETEAATPRDARTDTLEVTEAYDRAVESAVTAHILPMLDDDEVAVLALMLTLSATGAHEDVIRLADQCPDFRDDRRLFQALLLKAGSQAHLDRFDDALSSATEARRIAIRLRSPRRLARASIARSYSITANQWLSVVPGRPSRPTADQLRSLLAVLWTTVVTSPLGIATVLRLRRSNRAPSTNAYRLGCEYVEHLIRLGALLEGLRANVPLAGQLLDGFWLALERVAGNIGYTPGVLNVAKYRSRRGLRTDGPRGAVTRGIVLGDLVALTIAYRDAGLAVASGGGGPRPALATDGEPHAEALLDRALDLAVELNCPSLLLKTWLARRTAGCTDHITAQAVKSLLARIQCAAITLQRDAILAALVTAPDSAAPAP